MHTFRYIETKLMCNSQRGSLSKYCSIMSHVNTFDYLTEFFGLHFSITNKFASAINVM